MIFQHFNLLMQRTCLRNVCFPMELGGMKKADAEKRARELWTWWACRIRLMPTRPSSPAASSSV